MAGSMKNKESGDTYEYLLIEFITRGKKSQKIIEAVPSSWVTYNDKNKKFSCLFPPKPYINFDELIKEKAAADMSWETFSVKIRGCAVDYKDALSKLEKLKTKENAFSTDTEADSLQKTNNLERALRIEQLNKSLAQAKATVFGSSESDESNKKKKTKTVHKKSKKKAISSTESKSSDSSSTCSEQSTKSKYVKQKTFNNVGKEVNKSSTGKKNDTYGKKNYESSGQKSKEKNVSSKSGAKVKGTSLDQLNFNQKNIYADNYESCSTVSQTLPVPRSQFLSDRSNSTCEQLPWDFAMDAFVDANGVLVFPDAADLEKTSVHSIVNNTVKEKSDADRGVFLSQDQFLDIMKELTSLKIEQKNQSKILSKMERLLEQKCEGAVTIKSTWSKIFEVDFPLSDLETLYSVEEKLTTKPDLKTNFCSPMIPLIDTDDTLQKNVNAVMKKLISRDLALNFTATRKMADKIVFSLNVPNIYKCIVDTLSASFGKSESKVVSAVGTAFTLSQYWEGNRPKSSTKKDNERLDNSDDGSDATGNNKNTKIVDSKKAKSLKLQANK